MSGTEGGEEDTGCTHQTPSLATLFNPLTPPPPPPLPSHCTLCMCNYEREVSTVYHSAISQFLLLRFLYISLFSQKIFLINRFENFKYIHHHTYTIKLSLIIHYMQLRSNFLRNCFENSSNSLTKNNFNIYLNVITIKKIF